MNLRPLHVAGALALAAVQASAANVLVTTSENTALDSLVVAKLQGFGHTVTLGPAWRSWDGSFNLAPFESVYLQTNHNWPYTMPAAGQQAFADYVNAGGGLVTTEWLNFQMGPSATTTMPVLAGILPARYTATWRTTSSATFTRSTSDPTLDAGLPTAFTFSVSSIAGSESRLEAKAGATVFYTGDYSPAGLVGWNVGSGRVMSFSTVNGEAQWNDPNFSRLVSNAMTYSAVPEPATLGALALGLAALARRRRR